MKISFLNRVFAKNPTPTIRNRTVTTSIWCFLLSTSSSSSSWVGSTRTANRYSSTTTLLTAVSAMATPTIPSKKSNVEPRFRTWPITATKSLEPKLRSMGLQLPAEQIDGTSNNENSGSGGALSDAALSAALVSVGPAGRGGTGSFISTQGLIITNWHVAYDAVRRASLDAKNVTSTKDIDLDYVRDGFVARSLQDEIVGPNYECRITERCVDVSSQVLDSIVTSSTTSMDNQKKKNEHFDNEFKTIDTDTDDDKEETFDDEFIDDEEKKDNEEDSDSDIDPLERANKIRNAMQEIAQEAQTKQQQDDGSAASGNIRCDVVEMIPNKSYVLFTYRRLCDVRIVYVPPKSLGGFGGDTDNFEWPRHTADFTLLRAYVPPSSSSSSKGSYDGYHPDNVPYDSSQSFIKIRNPYVDVKHNKNNNIQVGDFAFLLGFPGSTMRYAPSSRLRYANEVATPDLVQDFTKKIQLITKYEKDSNEAALKLGSMKKGLLNELKRSKGKLIMMNKLKLIEERQDEEEQMIRNNDNVKEILERLDEIYQQFRTQQDVSSTVSSLQGIYGGSTLLAVGHNINEYLTQEKTKLDGDRETTYRKRNLPFLRARLTKRLKDMYIPHESALIEDCSVVLNNQFVALQKEADTTTTTILNNDDVDVDVDDELFTKCCKLMKETTILANRDTARNSVLMRDSDSDSPSSSSKLLLTVKNSNDDSDEDEDPIEKLLSNVFRDDDNEGEEGNWLNDPFVKVAATIWDVYKHDRDTTKALLSERDKLFAQLLEFQQQQSQKDDDGDDGGDDDYYPDCNGSLRISAGYVEGYKAGDAIVHTPFTTLSGLYDKVIEAKLVQQATTTASSSSNNNDNDVTTSSSEFECPERLYKMLENDKSIHTVPVCLLYSTDTVGGNSGSPVMNKHGELIGINFDRQRLGLMNEYKWSKQYSRSIGVDIRYILWLIGTYDNVPHLIDEMICTD